MSSDSKFNYSKNCQLVKILKFIEITEQGHTKFIALDENEEKFLLTIGNISKYTEKTAKNLIGKTIVWRRKSPSGLYWGIKDRNNHNS
uniref:Uncharacterized protein n=1 Tax=Pithovirus LCPAC404 TaxID=2506597 RepID=A0A481ZHG1_9VIRU|nr:MAG: hypothetical protein LCPAC404_03650 [Pithovirus LCPAC404]